MKAAVRNQKAKMCHVLGVCLPTQSKTQLSTAFPDCIYVDSFVHWRAQFSELCDGLGKVVIFLYLPAIWKEKWLRVSAVVHTSLVKVIGVHPRADHALYDRALEAEFAGVLGEDADAEAYTRAAASVERGELWFPRSYLSHRTRQAAATTSSSGLSAREEAIVALIADGTTNQEIADALRVTRETVRWHLRSIYAKLGVSDREAVYRMAKNRNTATSGAFAAFSESLRSKA